MARRQSSKREDGQHRPRPALDRLRIIPAISQVCRRRNVGHVLISTSAYELYASRLRKEHRTKGIRSATCHGVPLHPLPWLPQEMVITFGGKPDRKAKVILAGLRAENNEFVEKLVTSLVEEGYAHMRVTRLPHEPES